MKLEDVSTWEDYETYMKSQGPEGIAVVDKCTRVANAVSAAMDALGEIHMCMEIYDIDEVPQEESEAMPAM
ncbi:MAG: hypothetical protein IJM47_00805 [Synergistaceae bacterium]|nr:hypothetical protein [Synergistaceae bacterium]